MRSVTRSEMREIDRRAIEEFGVPGAVLMENAGRAVADEVDARAPAGPILVLAGPGNNGGDGFVAARHLHNRGYEVHIALFREPDKGDPATFLSVARRLVTVSVGDGPARTRTTPGAIVDALLGTGLTRPVDGAMAEWIHSMNARERARTPLVAVDIPSGLDADTGRPLGVAVEADVTVTMALPKVGFEAPEAAKYVGQLVVADIGMPKEVLA